MIDVVYCRPKNEWLDLWDSRSWTKSAQIC